MAIPPISAALPTDALRDYFVAIADSISLPILVQDASSYVGQAMSPQLYLDLLDRYGSDKVLFKTRSGPGRPQSLASAGSDPSRARVFEGSGGIMLVDNYRRGIVGAIPGMEFLPLVTGLWQALNESDEARIYQLYLPLCALVSLQLQAGLDGFLAIEKYVLHRNGLFATPRRRQPNSFELDAPTIDELERLLELADSALQR